MKEEILNIPAEDSKKEEKEESKKEIKEDKPSEISTNNIIGSINADETYVKYHVHTVMQNDTLEGILDKYKIIVIIVIIILIIFIIYRRKSKK